MRSVLTIAGSDSSGGAGIQADMKTIEAQGLFATCAITAVTAQNTTGVFGVEELPPDFVTMQMKAVFDDIPPDAVKVGMVSSTDIIWAIASALRIQGAPHIVVDPVMVATSGSALIEDEAVEMMVEELFPLAQVITPNIPEAEVLSGISINEEPDMIKAGSALIKRLEVLGHVPWILIKGGHAVGDEHSCNDLLIRPDGSSIWLCGKRTNTSNTHGTGCTLSSAIACGLAEGLEVEEACAKAKDYVTSALDDGLDLGQGSGPLNHLWRFYPSQA